MRKLRSRLTFANVVSVMALFVALGGTGAYAANEWTGANIQDESLTGSDVQGKAQTSSVAAVNGSLTGYDISGQPSIPAVGQPFIDGSLTTWDINDASLAGRDVQDGSLTTSDVFDGTLQGRDVQNNSLTGEDINESTLAPVPAAIADNSVTSAKVANGSLNDEDIGQGTFVNLTMSIGTVFAHSCRYHGVTGVNAAGDHLLLTPNYESTETHFIYSVEYHDTEEYAEIKVCNPTNGAIDDGTTNFNLLVIDAQ
jgi:uncharacterized protein YjbI with pentapeptide repeats